MIRAYQRFLLEESL